MLWCHSLWQNCNEMVEVMSVLGWLLIWSWGVLCGSQAGHWGGFTGLFVARTVLCALLWSGSSTLLLPMLMLAVGEEGLHFGIWPPSMRFRPFLFSRIFFAWSLSAVGISQKLWPRAWVSTSTVLLQEMSAQSSKGSTEKWEKGEEGQRRYRAGMDVVASTEERRKGEGQEGDKLF